jgi:hypothetical protein
VMVMVMVMFGDCLRVEGGEAAHTEGAAEQEPDDPTPGAGARGRPGKLVEAIPIHCCLLAQVACCRPVGRPSSSAG